MESTTEPSLLRNRIKEAIKRRFDKARCSATDRFVASGVPELFENVDIVLNELAKATSYILTENCRVGTPKIHKLTCSLIHNMLTVASAFKFEAWVFDEKMTDDEIGKFGEFRDDDDYLVNFCVDLGDDGYAFEKRHEHTAQIKLCKALAEYVKVSASFAKEIGAKKAADLWLHAFCILIRLQDKGVVAPYANEDMDKVFSYIDEAETETHVAWMYQQLPTMETLRKEAMKQEANNGL